MAIDNPICSSVTNANEETNKEAKCDCLRYWELLQQEAILKLSNERNSSTNLYKFEMGYEARARRIAAVYADFFLEKDKRLGANEKYRGRYYWMGLGAFASKTVATIYPNLSTAMAYYLSDKVDEHDLQVSDDNSLVEMGLTDNKSPEDDPELLNFSNMIDLFAAGNLWLYMDIAPWYYHWSTSKESFEDCLEDRDVSQYQKVTRSMTKIPWFDQLGKANHLKVTKEVKAAFAIMPKIEEVFDKYEGNIDEQYKQAGDDLLKHLVHLAWHEQGNILQELVWKDPAVKVGAQGEFLARHNKYILLLTPFAPILAPLVYLASEKFKETVMPDSTFVLSSDYNVKAVTNTGWFPWTKKYGDDRHNASDALIKGVKEDPYLSPFEGGIFSKATIIPDLESRMIWITEAAEKYHRIMLDKGGRDFLHAELEIISGWGQSTLADIQHHKSNDGQTEIDLARVDF